MKNRKTFIRLICFSAASFLLLYLFGQLIDFGVRRSDDQEFKKVNVILTKKYDPDIIEFGSSVGEKGFNSNIVAAKTGLKVYNCSIDGTNYWQYRGLVDEYNSYSSKHSIVLFFEAYFSFLKNPAIYGVERYAAHLDHQMLYNSLSAIDPTMMWRSRYIPLYKYTTLTHTYYKASFIGWKNYFLHKDVVDSLNGFFPTPRKWESDMDSLLSDMKPFQLEISKDVVQDYIKLVNRLQAKGKKVVVILPPIYERLYKEKVSLTPIINTIDSISKLTGCGFLNFSQSVFSRNKDNFNNSNHLNTAGADLFSSALADSLKPFIEKMKQ